MDLEAALNLDSSADEEAIRRASQVLQAELRQRHEREQLAVAELAAEQAATAAAAAVGSAGSLMFPVDQLEAMLRWARAFAARCM